jgi:hypothetical protein
VVVGGGGWVVETWRKEKDDGRQCKNNLVLKDYDNIMFLTLSNGHKKLSHGGKQFPFSMLNPTDVFKFVNKLLKKREKSSVMRNIEVDHHGYVPYKLLRKMINYVVKRKVEKFKVSTFLPHKESRWDLAWERLVASHHGKVALSPSDQKRSIVLW